MTLVWLDQVPPQPWRNGGGTTRPLLTWPADADADDWALRISVAEVTQPGPFSAFAGITRWFAVIDGAGVLLRWNDTERLLDCDSPPLRFDGGCPPTAELRGGATRDLNLMLRDSACSGTLRRAVYDEPWTDDAPWRAVFCTGPAVLELPGSGRMMPPRSLCFDPDAAGVPWRLLSVPRDTHPPSPWPSPPAAWWLAITPAALT